MAFKGEIKIKDPYKSSPVKQDANTLSAFAQMGMGLVEGFGAMGQRDEINKQQGLAQTAWLQLDNKKEQTK